MKILMIAFEAGRWGQARLVQPLREAGFQVAALCPAESPLAQTSFLERHFLLRGVRSSRRVEAALAQAMRNWQPELVIPGDESTVACLQALVRRGGKSRISPEGLHVIAQALGRPERFDAMLMKSDTLRLARSLGVRQPQSATVAGVDDALAAAGQIGYPVFVKRSFSWAGQGVKLCRNAAELAAGVEAARQPGHKFPFHAALKRLLHRDWYPAVSAMDVQQAITGAPAFYCGVAVGGRLIAGFAGLVEHTSSATGPSSVVRIGPHAAMQQAAQAMTAEMGLTGFIGFDFMIETGTGRAYLLECNPRPIPACHLGARIGVDLCAALAAGLRGDTRPWPPAGRTELVALFPQEWERAPENLINFPGYVDVPVDDAGLLHMIVAKYPGSEASMPEAAHKLLAPARPEPSPGFFARWHAAMAITRAAV